jgi:HK97 family phage major capsid protein
MTVKEYMAKKAKEKAKDTVTPGVTVTQTKKEAEKEQRTAFYKALIEKDRGAMANISTAIEKELRTKGQNVTVSADGGYLVPTSIADSILQKRTQLSGFRQLATTIANMPAKFDLPTEASKPTAYWVAEGAEPTESKSTFGRKSLVLHKIAGLVTFTYESLKDTSSNPSLQNLVEQQLAFVITQEENDAIVNGDGSDKPFGFRSSDITPASLAQEADTLGYTDLTKLRRKLPAAYRRYGVFVTSSNGALAMENVRDGNNNPIWRDGLTEDSPTRVLGRPVVEVDEIPSDLGTGTDETEIWYIDPSFYWLGNGEAMRIDWGTSDDDFNRDQIKLRVIDRIAGRPTIDEAFSKLTAVKG